MTLSYEECHEYLAANVITPFYEKRQSKIESLYLQEMVKMSPLQGSAFEVIPTSDVTALVGAAVSASRAGGA